MMTLAPVIDYVTTAEAAQISGYTEEYVRRLIRHKRIQAVQKGRAYWIEESSLREYLKMVAELGPQKFNRFRQAN